MLLVPAEVHLVTAVPAAADQVLMAAEVAALRPDPLQSLAAPAAQELTYSLALIQLESPVVGVAVAVAAAPPPVILSPAAAVVSMAAEEEEQVPPAAEEELAAED